MPEPIRGKAFASVAVAYIGSREEAEPHLAAYRAIPGMVMDLVGEVPLGNLGSIAEEPTDPMPGMQRSHLLDELDDDAITALVAAIGPDSGSPLTDRAGPPLRRGLRRRAGGRAARTERSPSRTTCSRSASRPCPSWSRRSRCSSAGSARRVAHVASGRTLLNFLEFDEDPGKWWSPATRDRLSAAKQASDPLQTIRSNRPVRG